MAKNKQTLTEQLFTAEETEVLDILEELKDKGDAHSIQPLLELLLTKPSYEVSAKTQELLYGMKDKKLQEHFFHVACSKKYLPVLPAILSIIWNADFYAGKNLPYLVENALQGGFTALFELLTILENAESFEEEEPLLESLTLIKQWNNPLNMEETKILQDITKELERLIKLSDA